MPAGGPIKWCALLDCKSHSRIKSLLSLRYFFFSPLLILTINFFCFCFVQCLLCGIFRWYAISFALYSSCCFFPFFCCTLFTIIFGQFWIFFSLFLGFITSCIVSSWFHFLFPLTTTQFQLHSKKKNFSLCHSIIWLGCFSGPSSFYTFH